MNLSVSTKRLVSAMSLINCKTEDQMVREMIALWVELEHKGTGSYEELHALLTRQRGLRNG